MLLAIVATTAVLTMVTSSIGVGIFSQHASAIPCTSTGNVNVPNSNGANVFKGGQGLQKANPPGSSPYTFLGNSCTIFGPTEPPSVFDPSTGKMHATLSNGGQAALTCHS